MLPAGGIFSLNPGPPSRKGSPMQVVRRTKSYAARKATKPMKPPVAAAPAAELVPLVPPPPVPLMRGSPASAQWIYDPSSRYC